MPAPRGVSRSDSRRRLRRAIIALFAVCIGVVLASAAYIGSLAVTPPSLAVDLPDGARDLSPDTTIAVTAAGFSLQLESLTLAERRIDPEGQVAYEASMPVRVQGVGSGRLRTELQGTVVRPDGGDLLSLDGRYELTIIGSALQLGWNGLQKVPLSQRVTFATAVTAHPLLPDASLVARIEDDISIPWNVPLSAVSYSVSPPVATSAWIDRQDPRISHLRFAEYIQGQSYQVSLTRAVDTRGVDWPQSRSLTISTPPPLSVVGESPANDAVLVSREIQPEIVFSENVANPNLVTGALSIQPEVAGHFEWTAPNRVRFVPDDTLPAVTKFIVAVQSGPEQLRGENGGFLSDGHALGFTTERGKVIDVNLSSQVMALLINDQPVWSARTATGVRGAETPPGHYTVQYKLPTARFRGTNPGGSTYDIPDVPWVMALFEDYTIHGAYWRTTFGQPGSNGCVSLTAADAKYVYDWAPVGTPVVIHY